MQLAAAPSTGRLVRGRALAAPSVLASGRPKPASQTHPLPASSSGCVRLKGPSLQHKAPTLRLALHAGSLAADSSPGRGAGLPQYHVYGFAAVLLG